MVMRALPRFAAPGAAARIPTVIKVAFVIPTLDRSGAEKQLMLLASRLPAAEFRVHVVALTRGGPYAEVLRESGIPVTILEKRGRLDPFALWKLRSVLRDIDPDVIHSWMFAGNAYTRMLFGRQGRPAVVVSERCVDSWKSFWQLWIDRRQRRRCRMLVANSRPVAEFYQRLGYPEERLTVIPNGIDVRDDAFASRAEAREFLKIPEHVPVVGFVGRLARQKRVRDLLWGVELLRHLQPAVRAFIVGDGPLRGSLQDFTLRIGTQDRVRFLGHRHDVRRILPAFDVLWLASDFEGQSNSIMEAMSAGLPVVASDIPANRELVVRDETGLLFPVGDCAALARQTDRLLGDAALARRLGEAGKRRMQTEFSVERMVQAHADLYREIVAQFPPVAGQPIPTTAAP